MKMGKLWVLVWICLFVLDGVCYFAKGQIRSCSFDNGLCGFTSVKAGFPVDFNWTRIKGVAHYRRPLWSHGQTIPDGPKRDHTSGTGFYMYARYPGPVWYYSGGLAHLLSPVYTNITCIKFYYFMHAWRVGGLEVLVKIDNNAPFKVWSIFGSVKKSWELATIPLLAKVDGNQTVQVYFQAVAQNGGNSASVGIDDVSLTSDQCSFSPAFAKPRGPIIDEDIAGSCTFDNTLCHYQNAKYYKWQKVRSGNDDYGPEYRDHTTSFGSYMQAVIPTASSKAHLISPPLYNISCVSFFFDMLNYNYGALNVYVKIQGNYTRVQRLTQSTGQKSVIVFGPETFNKTFNIVFEAVRGYKVVFFIVIDDIFTSNNYNSCLPRTPSPPTAAPITTPTATKGAFGDGCKIYKVLNSSERAITYSGKGYECDKNKSIVSGQWHRFMGLAGNGMPLSCVPEGKCGTRAPGWLNGSHPTIEEGIVTRKVCFSSHGNCCKWSTLIRVKNCSGFYVYELQKPAPSCDLRYCGNGPDNTSSNAEDDKENPHAFSATFDDFKIAIVVFVCVVVLLIALVIFVNRLLRRRNNPNANDFQLETLDKNEMQDRELLTEEERKPL